MPTYTVTLVEDDFEVRDRLCQLIEQHQQLTLVNACGTVSDGLLSIKNDRPNILLTDLGLPDGSGTDIIKAIHTYKLDCQAMVISGFQDEHIVFQALEAGASAYILKHDESHKITDAILSMMKGGSPMSPVIARLMLKRFKAQREIPDLPEILTERQIHILTYISQGFSSKEISEKLAISYYTVTTHIKNIYTKLQVNSRTEALHEAIKLGLIQ